MVTESLYALSRIATMSAFTGILGWVKGRIRALSIGGVKIESIGSAAGCHMGSLSRVTLDQVRIDCMMNVYCECGRIVWLDRSAMCLKLRIGKKLECTSCRNKRISDEIEILDRHFDGEDIFEDL